jgi:hypothetical protein
MCHHAGTPARHRASRWAARAITRTGDDPHAGRLHTLTMIIDVHAHLWNDEYPAG